RHHPRADRRGARRDEPLARRPCAGDDDPTDPLGRLRRRRPVSPSPLRAAHRGAHRPVREDAGGARMAPDRGAADRAARRRRDRRSRGAWRAQGCPSTRDAAGRANRVGRRMTLSHSHRRSSMMARSLAILLLASIVLSGATPAVAQAPAGQMTWAVHVSLAPTWFDPAEHTGIITLMMVLYAVHDALVKPMPGNPMAPSLAESWTVSKDGLSYEFVLRKGVVFHNGDPFTAEDVKFSFERYKGAAAKLLKDKVAAVEIVDPFRVRFRLKEPWPDFMTFYATPASGAGWIVPKKYVEKVGDEGFKKAPVGAGPYKLTSFNPGI